MAKKATPTPTITPDENLEAEVSGLTPSPFEKPVAATQVVFAFFDCGIRCCRGRRFDRLRLVAEPFGELQRRGIPDSSRA